MSSEFNKEKFFGWRMIITANLIDFISAGLAFYAFTAVFSGFLLEEFSTSRFLVSLTISVLLASAGVFSPIMGFFLDRFPIRKILAIGAILFGLGLILLSTVKNLTQFLLIYGTLVASGMTIFGNLSSAKLISNWFKEKIGTALGYASIGLSMSGVIIPPIAVFLISIVGWRNTYLIFGVFVLIVCSILSFIFVIDKPSDVNQHPDGNSIKDIEIETQIVKEKTFLEILAVRSFWLLVIIFSLQITANLGVYTQISLFAQDLDYSPLQASWIYSVAAFHAALGKIVFGKLLDYLGPRRALWISLLCHGLGIATLIFSQNLYTLLFSVSIMGLGLGGSIPLMNSTFSIAFDNVNFGKARGLAVPCMVPMQIVAAPLSGWFYDIYGNYTLAFSINVFLCVLAGIIVFFLQLPERKLENSS
jgi:MFS family permease